MIVFALDTIWVVFFGGVRLKVGQIVLRSTTVEFPTIALLVSFFSFLLIKGKWKESLLLVVSLLLSCLVGEGLLRLVDHPSSQPFIDAHAWQQPSKGLGFTLVPNFEGRGPLDVPIKTNSQGFRDDGKHTLTKPADVIRILGLGDSFTFGWGVSLEDTFLKKLEGNLEGRTGLKIETINAGVPMWDLNQYYVYYREYGVQYQPDIVVLSYFFNDAPDIFQESIPADTRHQKGGQHTGGVLRYSYLFNFIKSFAHQIRRENRLKRFDHLSELAARRKYMTKPNNDMVFDPGPDQERTSTTFITTLLKNIQSATKTHKGQLVLMYIPDIAQLHYPEWQHINRILVSITEKLDIPFLDMTPIFESDPNPGEFYFWPKDAHATPRGHEKMAEALTTLICQALEHPNIPCDRSKE